MITFATDACLIGTIYCILSKCDESVIL